MRTRQRKVDLKTLLASILATLAAALRAKAQTVTAQVLYPMQTPTGFSNTSDSGEPQTAAGGQVVGYGSGTATSNSNNALLWSGPSGNAVDLNPTSLSNTYTQSIAYGTNGTQQVGYALDSNVNQDHAMFWAGTAASAVDLNPTNLTGFTSSSAYGISANGSQQVGVGSGSGTGFESHALLWSQTAASAVDLNPTNLTGFTSSSAIGTNGSQQVGLGSGSGTGGNNHALLWSGSAGTAVDLNPTVLTGYTSSMAYGISANGSQEVGEGTGSGTGNKAHALLWFGTAASAVDLNPTDLSGFTASYANATNGTFQVGYGSIGSDTHALLWAGTAASAIDLQTLLPSTGSWLLSEAYTIDSSGNIYGDAYGTYQSNTGYFAVEWTAVPEPASFSVFAVGGLLALRRRPRSAQPIWASV